MMTDAERPAKEQWPSVDLAQAFVLPPYQWMLSRLEAVDSRLYTRW